MLYLNNKRVIIFIDYEAIYNIVNTISLNTLSTDRTNRRLTNALIYLSAYSFNVYYILRQLNLISDAFSRLRTLGDNVIRIDKTVEPILDII